MVKKKYFFILLALCLMGWTRFFGALEALPYLKNHDKIAQSARVVASKATSPVKAAKSSGSTSLNLQAPTISKIDALRASAISGDAISQRRLGDDYIDGKGVLQDDDKAVYWLRKAADRGDARAETDLGEIYAHGISGIALDYRESIYWYRKAAIQGNVNAEINLGLIYDKAVLGGQLHNIKAAYWWRKAADQGAADAEYDLGMLYTLGGQGVAPDHEKGTYWLHQAALSYRKAASQGSPQGESQLGYLYSKGLGVPLDDKKAAFWYLKAANQSKDLSSKLDAEMDLGVLYFNHQHFAHARYWEHKAFLSYLKGARYGNANGEFEVGQCYYEGIGVPRNRSEGIYWLWKSAAQGDFHAKHFLKKIHSP